MATNINIKGSPGSPNQNSGSGWVSSLPVIGDLLNSATNIHLANKQMRFQRRMSDTAHQREVRDLRKAGLNPILSATGGRGATTPPGALAKVDSKAGAQIADLYLRKKAMNSAINLQQQQADQAQATATKERAQASYYSGLDAKLESDTNLVEKQTEVQEVIRRLQNLQVNEAQAVSDLYKEMGSTGKGIERYLPLLIRLLTGPGRR